MAGLPERVRSALSAVQDLFSPNWSSRGSAKVTCVIIHTTEGSFLGSLGWMRNPASQVSSHYLVSDEDGTPWNKVVRLVPEDKKAWTARSANPISINYELAGYARRSRLDWLGRYKRQLETTAALVASDCIEYGIPVKMGIPGIVGHMHLNSLGYPNNHTDPGLGFPWPEFYNMVNDFIHVPPNAPDAPEVPAKTNYPCLPKEWSRVPRWAWRLSKWHLNGRKGKRPRAPHKVPKAYWQWLNCKFFGGGGHGRS